MPFEICSLVLTRKDPNRHGVKPANTNNGVMLGQRRLHPGESALIGDAFYDRNKKTLDRYLELRLISIKKLPTRSVDESVTVIVDQSDVSQDTSPELVVAQIEIVDSVPQDAVLFETVALLEPVPVTSVGEVSAETVEQPTTLSAPATDTIPVPQKRVVKRVGKNVVAE